MHALGDHVVQRYGPEFMAWIQSPSVRAAEDHKMGMMHTSKELHQVMSDAYTLYNEFAHGGVEMGWGMNEDGSYDEYMSNESIRHVFEELYVLSKDIAALYKSPMARNQRRLEKLTLNDPHFQAMFKMLQDDIDVHSWGQLETRLHQLGERVATELKNCPHFQKVVGILMRMKTLVENGREVTEMGSEEEWVNWW
jgi:hypothetical protein